MLLDQNGKPVPNSKGQPILINSEGKPINLVDNDKTLGKTNSVSSSDNANSDHKTKQQKQQIEDVVSGYE